MLGSIIGDICGSHYEFRDEKGFFLKRYIHNSSSFTDDSVLTCATAHAMLTNRSFSESYLSHFHRYKDLYSNGHGINIGYGPRFARWAMSNGTIPYKSEGNGAAMRVAPIAFMARTESELLMLTHSSAVATHNTPSGLKSAEATALAIYLCLQGRDPKDVRHRIECEYYNLSFDINELHRNYRFTALADKTVPQAIFIGLTCRSFDEAIGMALYIGGDTDTIACIACAIAEARFGIPVKFLRYLKPIKDNASDLYQTMVDMYQLNGKWPIDDKNVKLTYSQSAGWIVRTIKDKFLPPR